MASDTAGPGVAPALARWAGLLEAAAAGLVSAEPAWWASSYAPGKWRRTELLGHLIDSAAHNHLRLARCLAAPGRDVEAGYDQVALVAAQNYAEVDPATLAALWLAYNRLLLSIAMRLTPAEVALPCRIEGDTVRDTVGRLLVDYVEHLERHLRQLWPNIAW